MTATLSGISRRALLGVTMGLIGTSAVASAYRPGGERPISCVW